MALVHSTEYHNCKRVRLRRSCLVSVYCFAYLRLLLLFCNNVQSTRESRHGLIVYEIQLMHYIADTWTIARCFLSKCTPDVRTHADHFENKLPLCNHIYFSGKWAAHHDWWYIKDKRALSNYSLGFVCLMLMQLLIITVNKRTIAVPFIASGTCNSIETLCDIQADCCEELQHRDFSTRMKHRRIHQAQLVMKRIRNVS